MSSLSTFIRFLSLGILVMGITACSGGSNNSALPEARYFSHLEYLLELKQQVAQAYWPEFSESITFSPMVYYTRQGTYVLSPNDHILSLTPYKKEKKFLADVPRIKLPGSYTDTTSFQFANSYGFDSTELYFEDNVLNFSSFELTQKFIPDINDIQDWSVMVIHELFHSYQRSVPAFKRYFIQLEIPGGPDEYLGRYYKEHEWYATSVKEENALLIGIWKDGHDLVSGLKQYEALRTKRISRIKEEFGIDIREVEDYEIMVEGHARYSEALAKRFLSAGSTKTDMLSEEDLSLITGMFEGYQVVDNKGLYNLYNARYYYALGFNISMILEKHLPDYKSSIYKEHHNFNPYLEELMGG